MTVRVGINGFGRIGRAFFRAALESGADLRVVGINDVTDAKALAQLLRYDSVHGRLGHEVHAEDGGITVADHHIAVSAETDLSKLPWRDVGADVVIEATGKFTDAAEAAKHRAAGARKVIISAPANGADVTVLAGVNDDMYDPAAHQVLSLASCTTNSVVPMVKILDDAFGIEQGFMTTAHAYTNDQSLLDGPHKDPRRARAAAMSIIPTTTGAARAAAIPMPHLEGRLDGIALRVPVPDGSITDLVAYVSRETSVEEVNEAFRVAATGYLSGIVSYVTDPIVSSDIIGDPASCIFDSLSTMVNGRMVKVFGWYDNEWGFSSRLVDLAVTVGNQLR